LIRGENIQLKPPVEDMDSLWSREEKFAVQSRMAVAAIGSAKTVRERLTRLHEATQADEFIFVSDLYAHEDRLRSFEITAKVMGQSLVSI